MHTLGPWEQHGDDIHTIIGDAQQLVAIVYGESSEARMSNSFLVKAAPELLEALKEVVRISDRDHVAWNAAKAAIAKAEGK